MMNNVSSHLVDVTANFRFPLTDLCKIPESSLVHPFLFSGSGMGSFKDIPQRPLGRSFRLAWPGYITLHMRMRTQISPAFFTGGREERP